MARWAVKCLARRDRLPASLSPERPASSSRHWTNVSKLSRPRKSSHRQKAWIRFSWVPWCVLLMSCSTNPPHLPSDTIGAPAPSKVTESLKKVAAEAKLEEPHEISAPIRAHPISSVPWIICLRSGATELSKRRPYAVFM
jgi:hypothetical protein